MPELSERRKLLFRHLDEYEKVINKDIIEFVASNTVNINSSDICKLCEHIKRQLIISPETPVRITILSELYKISPPIRKEDKILACKRLKDDFPVLTQREISQITHISLASVSRYLSKERE